MQPIAPPPRFLPKKFKKGALEYAHELSLSENFHRKALLPTRNSFNVFRKIATKYHGFPFHYYKSKTGRRKKTRFINLLIIMHLFTYGCMMGFHPSSYTSDAFLPISSGLLLVFLIFLGTKLAPSLISRTFHAWNASRCIKLLEHGVGVEATFLGTEKADEQIVRNYGFIAEDGAYYKIGSSNGLSSTPEVGDKKLLIYLPSKANQGILYDDIYLAPLLQMDGTTFNFQTNESGDIALKYANEGTISFLTSASELGSLDMLRLTYILELILGALYLLYPLIFMILILT